MSSTNIQLYGNNAKSTTLVSVGSSDTVFSVQAGQGSRFPAITASNQYFLVTLESAGVIEVCRVTAISGDLLTVVRGQENTSAVAFPLGTQVQMRVTRDTLAKFARLTDRLSDLDTVDNLPIVSTATGNSFLCQSSDDSGNPIVATKTVDRWRFPTHSVVKVVSTAASSTTTGITSPDLLLLPVATGRYILNFITGACAGQSRLLTGITGTTVSWNLPTSVAPDVGSQFEVLVSNAYQVGLISSLSDESIINALIFGA